MFLKCLSKNKRSKPSIQSKKSGGNFGREVRHNLKIHGCILLNISHINIYLH